MDAEERYQRLHACLEELREANETTPVLVEGIRDVRALRELGLTGPIEIFNAGKPIDRVAHHLAHDHQRVILLLDWDRTGGHLVRRLQEHLVAQVDLDLGFRKELALVSQVKSVEDLPAALRLTRERARAAGAQSQEE